VRSDGSTSNGATSSTISDPQTLPDVKKQVKRGDVEYREAPLCVSLADGPFISFHHGDGCAFPAFAFAVMVV
jgi:hypothetical protein